MKNYSLLVFLVLFSHFAFAQWNPDAGLIIPHTIGADVSVSSGTNPISIVDGNPNSYWESSSPLPDNYVSRRDLNIFLVGTKYTFDPANQFATNAVDGVISSKSEIFSGNFEIIFNKPETISQLSIKFNTRETINIKVVTQNSILDYYYSTEDNYGLKTIPFSKNEKVLSIKMESIDSFEIFEIAGLYKLPEEEVLFDLKKNVVIGWIGSRHFNGNGVKSISVFVSSDKRTWKEVVELNPKATSFVSRLVTPEVVARYVKVKFVLEPRNYQKAKLHEFEIYDRYGPFGKPPEATRSNTTYGESFGVNAIWGWGYSVPSEKLPEQTGPELFNKVAKLARNYHSLNWDIKKPGQNPNYSNMEMGNGTKATPWVNWFTEYNTWIKAGFSIDACIMFNNQHFHDSLWLKPETESYEFGKYFGSYFLKAKKLTSVVEIGNEPWEYSLPVYKKVLAGMSRGLSENSSSIKILPCATQAFIKENELGNYISRFIDKENTKFISGLNTHIYSYINDLDGQKIAVNPEDPRSETWSVVNLMRFSKENLNSIPVYVTEYGYDSRGGGDDCTHSVCLSEIDQAIYGTRMTMILYRLGIEEFYWYYYANVDYTSFMHNRSGLLSSYSKGFEKKLSFKAFEVLQNQLGDYYFDHIIMENENAYIYAFSDSSGKIKRIVAWRPTSGNHAENEWIEFPCSKAITDAYFVVDDKNNQKKPSYVRTVNNLKINLSGIPVVIIVK